MKNKPKVVLLHNIMAPYKFPLFKHLANDKDINFQVWFMSVSAKNRKWSIDTKHLPFRFKILPKLELNIRTSDLLTIFFNYTFPLEFIRNKFDILIVNGWQDPACILGFFLCKLSGRKYIIWSESTKDEPSWRRKITLPLVRYLAKNADACIAIGTKSSNYFKYLGANEEKIFISLYTVDVKHFSSAKMVSKSSKAALKRKLKLKGLTILYVGQFVARKGLIYLIEAFSKIKKSYPDASLLLVGYGEQREKLMNLINTKKLPDVVMQDHVEIDQMPLMYSIADIFVLPSYEETWGLVVNEAMSAGLPIITTRKVGSSLDLVKEDNGLVIKEKNSLELYKALELLISDTKLRAKMGRASSKRISDFTPENAGNSFIKAIKYSLSYD